MTINSGMKSFADTGDRRLAKQHGSRVSFRFLDLALGPEICGIDEASCPVSMLTSTAIARRHSS